MKQKKGNVQKWFVDAGSEYRQIRLRVGRHVLAAKTSFQAVELINTTHRRLFTLPKRVKKYLSSP